MVHGEAIANGAGRDFVKCYAIANQALGRRRGIDPIMEHRVLTRSKAKELAQEEELLPGIPNEITLDCVTPKLPWMEFKKLALVSRAWLHSIRTRRVHDGRVRSHSTETLVLVSPIRFRKISGPPPPAQNRKKGRKKRTPLPNRDGIALYSMRDDSHVELPAIPSLRHGIPQLSQCVALDGKLYVLGGVDPKCRLTSKVYVLDLAAGRRQWKECASMREPRAKFGCGVIHGKIYVFGGACFVPVCGSEVYDPKENAWSPIRPMTTLRFDHCVENVGEELLVHSGKYFDRDGFEANRSEEIFMQLYPERVKAANFVEIYNPVEDEWRVVKPFGRHHEELLLTARGSFHSLSPLGLHFRHADAGDNSWTHFYRENSENLQSFFSLFSAVVGPVDAVVARMSYPVMAKFHSDFVANLLTVLAVSDESLVIVSYFDRKTIEMRFSLFQSRGFCSKEIVWQEVPFSFDITGCTRLYPVHL